MRHIPWSAVQDILCKSGSSLLKPGVSSTWSADTEQVSSQKVLKYQSNLRLVGSLVHRLFNDYVPTADVWWNDTDL